VRISNKYILLLLASIFSGISLSLFSLNYSRTVSSQPVDFCQGPAVVGYECPSLPIEEIAGYPIIVERTYYTYDFEDDIVLITNATVESIVANYSLTNIIINSLILIGSSFLLLSTLNYIYKKINNKFLKKSLDILLNLVSILLPLLVSIVLFFEVSNTVSNNRGPELIDTPLAMLAFIVWILPIIFIYDTYKLTQTDKRLFPIISIVLIMICWFYIIAGDLLF
jgi:hypothetical protein